MRIFILVYIILLTIAGGFFLWRLFDAIDELSDSLRELRTRKFSQLTSSITSLKTTIDINKNELSRLIHNNENTIKAHVTTESIVVKDFVLGQLTSQTNKVIAEMVANRQIISNLIVEVQNTQKLLIKNLKDHNNKLGNIESALNTAILNSNNSILAQLKNSTQKICLEGDLHKKDLSTKIEDVHKSIDDNSSLTKQHLKLLENDIDKHLKQLDSSVSALSISLKSHTEKITTSCSNVINTEKELNQGTRSSFNQLNNTISKYLAQLKQIDDLYGNLQNLYTVFLEEEKKIIEQESSLNSMVSRHSQLFEITLEMNNTAKEIFEFMKLYLLQATFDNLNSKSYDRRH